MEGLGQGMRGGVDGTLLVEEEQEWDKRDRRAMEVVGGEEVL